MICKTLFHVKFVSLVFTMNIQIFFSIEVANSLNEYLVKTGEEKQFEKKNSDIFQCIKFPIGIPYRDVMKRISRSNSSCISNNQVFSSEDESTNSGFGSTVEQKHYNGKYSKQVGKTYIYTEPKTLPSIRRKFIKITVPDNRRIDRFRLIDKDAERAFITKDYDFINLTYGNLYIDTLIEHIENANKIVKDYELYRGITPMPKFNSWEPERKRFFCQHFINNSILLRKDHIYYDDHRFEEIVLLKVRIDSKKLAEKIESHEMKVKFPTEHDYIVQCPCLKQDTKMLLGLSPVYYKHRKTIDYAFIYDPVSFTESDLIHAVTIRCLSKISQEMIKNKPEDEKLRKRERVAHWLEDLIKHKNEIAGDIEWFLPMKWIEEKDKIRR